MKFENKVAIITGSTRGICVKRLMQIFWHHIYLLRVMTVPHLWKQEEDKGGHEHEVRE